MSEAEFSISLPLDIERDILELAARIDRGTTPILVRVSTYVSQWILPILHEILVMHMGVDHKEPSAESVQRYGRHVRHLLIGNNATTTSVAHLLHSCPNITNLAIWVDLELNDTAIERIKQLPLTRLSIHLDSLFELSQPHSPQAEQVFSCLTQLTHLDIASNAPISLSDILRYLPRLTYLSIPEDWQDTQLMSEVLEGLPQLNFLILLREVRGADAGYGRCIENGTIPEHIIATCDIPDYVDDWRRGARGENDVWEYIIHWTESIWKHRTM